MSFFKHLKPEYTEAVRGTLLLVWLSVCSSCDSLEPSEREKYSEVEVAVSMKTGAETAGEERAGEGGDDQAGETLPECRPEFVSSTGVCLLGDPTEYDEYVSNYGSAPSPEELLTIDDSFYREQETPALKLEGIRGIDVYLNEARRVGIRATDEIGRPVSGVRVNFWLGVSDTSQPREATLSASQALTDRFGIASIEVYGGRLTTEFDLLISSEISPPLQYRIRVIERLDVNDPLPPAEMCPAIEIAGIYTVESQIALAPAIGDLPFNAMTRMHNALSEPDQLISEGIRYQVGGFFGDDLKRYLNSFQLSLFRDREIFVWANQVLTLITGLTEALTSIRIRGTMMIGRIQGPDCEVPITHSWDSLFLHIPSAECQTSNDRRCPEYIIDLRELGVSKSEAEVMGRISITETGTYRLEIGEHQLQLNSEIMLITFLENALLPNLFEINSFEGLLNSTFECDRLSELTAEIIGWIALFPTGIHEYVKDVCVLGLRTVSREVLKDLMLSLDHTQFSLDGQADLVIRNNNQLVTEIINGLWKRRANTSLVYGDFTGERR